MPEDQTPDPRAPKGRPLPVGGMWPGSEGRPSPTESPGEGQGAWTGAEAPAEPARTGPGFYAGELRVAGLAVLLAATTFLPWYTVRTQGGMSSGAGPSSASGWSSGTWGPIIFFLALASAALVGLRRAGVRVSLPFDEPLLHEVVGWVSVVGVVVKSRFVPNFSLYGQETRGIGIWVALAAGFGLAIFAGRMLPRASVVLLPGWYRGAAGVTGAAILVAALAGGLAFGFVNDAGGGKSGAAANPLKTEIVKGRLHRCARGLPVPAGLKVSESSRRSAGTFDVCVVSMGSSQMSVKSATAVFQAALKKAGWRFTVKSETAPFAQFELKTPRCGVVVISTGLATLPGGSPGAGAAPQQKGVSVTVTLYACPAVTSPASPG